MDDDDDCAFLGKCPYFPALIVPYKNTLALLMIGASLWPHFMCIFVENNLVIMAQL
jgi:hypothetical protein